MPVLAQVIVFFLGAAVGSFLNVVIERVHQGQEFIRSRSACPHCRHILRWFELIPVVSFLIQAGRCRRCGHKLTWQYLGLEILTGLCLVLVMSYATWPWAVLAGWVTISGMILIGVFDGRWGLIPDGFTLVLIVGAVASSLITARPLMDILLGALAGGLFFYGQYAVSRRTWVGSGDVGLGIGLGILLGWRMLGLALLLAYLVGGLMVALIVVSRRRSIRDTISFGPYLMGGGLAAWMFGERIVEWYFQHAIFR